MLQFFLTACLIFAFFFYHFYWKRRNFPPGPLPIPFLGNILEIVRHSPGYNAYIKWHKKYGPIHTFWIAESPIVAISDYTLLVETFQKDADTYTGRQKQHPPSLFNQMRGGKYGVLFTDGEVWQEQRKFALDVFRDLGLGKNLMQEKILMEVSSIISMLTEDLANGKNEQNFMPFIEIGTGSIINNLMFGYRYDRSNSSEFYHLKTQTNQLLKTLGNPLFFYMQKHQRKIEGNVGEAHDFVEAFLKEKKKREFKNEHHHYIMPQLMNICWDLWVAGQESTAATLSWAITYLTLNPNVQEKMQKELDSVVGSDRLITMDDKIQLPYTQAVINEAQRVGNIIPMNLRHTTTRDVTVNGYFLPKGTDVIPQISVVLYDEKVFPNPLQFDPNRFLDESKKLKKIDELIPFSLGKRQCLGEGMARMELFLFLSNIINHFKFSQCAEKPLEDPNKRKIGGTVLPDSIYCHIEKRF